MRIVSTTIEQLELEVQSSATSAVAQLDTLASSLSKVKSATKGGVGLTAVARQLTTLNTALNGIGSTNADNLNKMAHSLQVLSSCGNLKLSSSVANQISNLGTAVRSLNGADFSSLSQLADVLTPLSTIGKSNLNSFISQLQRLPQAVHGLNGVDIGGLGTQISELVSALSPLSQMGKNNLTSFVTQLGKIPTLMQSLKTVNIGELALQVQQLADAFAPLATQMQAVSNGFAAFPARIQKLITSTNNLSKSNNKASTSYVNLAAKISIAIITVRKAASVLAGFIAKSNQYVEDLNLFTASMGEFASAAREYAERVSEIVGIDPSEWLRNQGVFMTITKGFGVASDRAYKMSRNLTQLGYDISSFFNIPFEDAFQKLQSGIAGELEPLRRLGYDLSVARLQQEAYTLGIKKKVSAMTQAEKAELRYYAIMTQVTTAQGDMARTLNAPANQLRILRAQLTMCARAIGNIFIPILNAILPYAIAVAKVIRRIADAIARLFGFELPKIDYSGIGATTGKVADSTQDIADNAQKIGDGLGDATKQAKELKNALLGIDELNIISPPDDSDEIGSKIGRKIGGGIGDGEIGDGGGLGIDLPEYDFLKNILNSKVDEIVDKMIAKLKEMLSYIVAIGAGFAAWKIAKSVADFIKYITSFKGFGIGWAGLGALGLLSDLNEFRRYFQDFLKNGATFQNVVGMISEFTGAIGDCLIIFGNLKIGGALKIAEGIGELVIAIRDIWKNDLNWKNVNTAIRSLTNIAIGIGAFTGNLKVAAWGVAIQGFASIIMEIEKNWKAIKKGDWSGVDKATLIIGALQVLGGLATALNVFSKLKAVADASKASKAVATVATATETLNTTVSTKLSPKLISLAKNLGLGIVIVTEVAAASLLITGAIILLGKELEQVGIAWKPVIANGGTIAAAMGIGVGIFVVIGAVTAALGTAGTALIANLALGIAVLAEIGVATLLFVGEIWAIGKGLDQIGQAWQPILSNGGKIATAIGLGIGILVAVGVATAALGVVTVASAGTLPLAIGIGTAILAELGIATGLFLVEIWAIGKGLDEIRQAWQPVLDNGRTIATAISLGTALLVGIGVVTAALGVATVASAGLLPLAIGLGTALLVELAAAFVQFCESLVATADELGNNLAPALNDLNGELPTLSDNMNNFVNFMTEFANHVVAYTKVSSISALSATIDTIIGWLTQDPIDKLANDVDNVYKQTTTLNEKLNLAVPELKTAINLLKQYKGFLTEMETLCNSNGVLSTGMFVNMKEVGRKLVTGFVDGIKSKSSDFSNAAKTLVSGFKNSLNTNVASCKSSFISWASNLKNWFTSSSFGAINRMTFGNYAKDIVSGFNDGIINSYAMAESGMVSFANTVTNAFTGIVSYKVFYDIARDVVSGFNNGINYFYDTTRPYMRKWANDAAAAYKAALRSHSPSKRFMRIGEDTVLGYNLGISNLSGTTKDVVTDWANSFTSVSPTMRFAVDTSALKYYSSDSFAQSVSADVATHSTVTATGFKEGMEEFYREYIEPTLSQMADDMRRQADKQEQTVVQIGNRVINDVITTQKKANGYVFAR